MTRSIPVAALLLAFLPFSGPATAQVAQDVIFHANLHEHPAYNDVWGYTAPDGREYALLGTTGGAAVINVTDPAAPYETGFFPGASSTWRDLKTYLHHAYVTNEASGGIAILDLSDPENPVSLPAYTGIATAHNLFIDETTGRLYTAGADIATGGTRILSLADPANPVEIGSWETVYLHDVMVQDGRLYGSAIDANALYVLDVTDPAAVTVLGTVSGYPVANTHNAWATPSGGHVLTTDETAGAACRMWDVSDPAAIAQTDTYQPNPSTIPHNAHIDGGTAYISHYTLGVRLVDVSDPSALVELGWYDTWPTDDNGTTNGCWGAFPFFGTTPGLFVASDRTTGLYVLEYRGPLGTVAGTVTEAGTGIPIVDADVVVTETGLGVRTDSTGAYVLQDAVGAVTVEASAFGSLPSSAGVTIAPGATVSLDFALAPAPGASVSGSVTAAAGGAAIEGARVELLGTPLLAVTDAAGVYDHPSVPAGHYTVRVRTFGHDALDIPLTVAAGVPATVDAALGAAHTALDFETSGGGWSVSGGASGGDWEWGDPVGTASGTVQPEDDHTPAPGTNAWITELAGVSVLSGDVDNGATVLTTGFYALAGLSGPRVAYWRWYQTGAAGNTTRDAFTVEASSDAGATWTVIDETDRGSAGWTEIDVALSDFVTPSNFVRFRFTARDTGAASVTEAGIDDFEIYVRATSVPTAAPAAAAAAATGGARLGAPHPNPVRGGAATTLRLELPRAGRVTATVHDVAGRRVAELLDTPLAAGAHRIVWDGSGPGGRQAPAGVYLVRVRTPSSAIARKLLRVR